MDLQTVAIFFIMALTNAGTEDLACSKNEEPGCESACAPTCQNRKPPKICTMQCVSLCVCKKDYIREGPGGICVPKSCQDVPICKKHEKFVTCPTSCPLICNQTVPTFCLAYCLRVGCVCEDGYVRESENGKCIPECNCTFKCTDTNKIFNDCKTMSCPGTCSEPERICKRCIRECICKEGYLLEEKTRQCVKKEDCTKVSPSTN